MLLLNPSDFVASHDNLGLLLYASDKELDLVVTQCWPYSHVDS